MAGLISTCHFFLFQQGERPLILGGQKQNLIVPEQDYPRLGLSLLRF